MRGDLVTIATQGDFGKPRPALVIQSDLFGSHPSVTVLPLTSTLVDAPLLRVGIEPSPTNGLTRPLQVMIDKAVTLRRDRVGTAIGRLEREDLVSIERRLAVFLGIAT